MKLSPIAKILSAVLLLAIVLYFGVEIYRYFSNPFSTTLTYDAAAEDSIPLSGWIVRQEEVFHADAATVTHPLGEGEKAGYGQTIAVAYQSARSLETVSRIETLTLQLEQLEFARNSYLDADAALKLDSSITGNILSLRQRLSGGDYTSVSGDTAVLKTAVLKRTHAYSSIEEVQSEIAAVQEQIRTLRASLSDAQYVAAPRAGLYSALCDGYEGVLTPDFLRTVTPSALNGVAPAENRGNVGKLIYGDTWYYAAVIDAGRAQELKAGQMVTLRLTKGLERDISVTVRSISGEEDGRAAIVLACDKYLPLTTSLRHQSAALVLRSYEGLRIPSTALRQDTDGQLGVYCVTGITARFKPVDVVYQGSGYTLVAPQSEATGSAVLRRGDEIIITASRLEDGLVVR
ncbi:MAG: hypothetical protein J5482_00360 [Oscillospiraceae bacterium]|nr:hypothetical protein [Oscillospiraceae bacterium]